MFCPVAGCPCADPLRARGWASATTMHAHIDAHLAGGLQGDVPDAWFRAQGRQRCQVCGLSVSTRHGVHPTCRPQARAAAGQDGAVRRDDPLQALPSIAEIQAGRTPTLRHVPAAARSLWCKVLTKALAAVVHYNDLCSWQELLLLPQCVLNAPPRGGRKHAKAAAAYTLAPWIGCAAGKMVIASCFGRAVVGLLRSTAPSPPLRRRTLPPAWPVKALKAKLVQHSWLTA